MFIETIHKLKLRREEADVIEKCYALLEDICNHYQDVDLSNVEYDEMVYASDVLLRLNTDKELY